MKLFTITALQSELGIPRRQIDEALQDVPPDGEYLGRPAWRLQTVIPLFYDVEHDGAKGHPEQLPPKERLDWWDGTRTRISLMHDEGELVDEETVRRSLSLIASTIVNAIEALPDYLERDCGATPSQVQECQAIIDQVRERAYHRALQEAA